jgi:hypothetical protein
VNVLNQETNEIEEVPVDQAVQGFSEGRYRFRPEDKIKFTTEVGKRVLVSPEKLQTAINRGWMPVSEEDQKEEELERKYGNREGTAAALGAARGLTARLSDVALTKLGIMEPEAISEITKRSPIVAGGAELLTTVAPLLATGGTSAAAQATAKVGAIPNLIAKGGVAAEKAVASVIRSQGVSRSVARMSVEKAVPKAVAGAAEGAAYGFGHALSEESLGDAELNAETLMSTVGLGALVGGSVGAILGTGSALLKKRGEKIAREFGVKPQPAAEAAATQADNISIDGTAKPTGPIKLQGEIKFDIPDDEILKQAAPLNPKAPLQQNDLQWLKANGLPDELGRPTVFQKIGTEEIPTLNTGARGQYTIEDAVHSGMKKLKDTSIQLDAMKENILRDSNLTLSRRSYMKWIDDEISAVKQSGNAGDPIGQRAIKELQTFKKAAKALPEEMDAMQIKQRLTAIRDSGKIYTKSGGLKEDFVSETFNNFQRRVDDYLKDNLDDYAALMKEYAPKVKMQIALEKHLNWDWDTMTSDFKTNWLENRVVKPFQNQLYGGAGGGLQADAKLLEEFAQFAGVDLNKAVKANLVYGKLNPELAEGLQKGTWGKQVAEGVGKIAEAVTHPAETAKKALAGTAKIILTGEAPDFIVNARAEGVRSLLMGHGADPRSVGFLNKAGNLILKQRENAADLIKGMFTGKGQRAFRPASVNAVLSYKYRPGESKSKTRQHAILARREELSELASNPQALIERLAPITGPMSEVAPNITAAMQQKAAAAVSYLYNSIPKDSHTGENLFHDESRYAPADSDIAKFERRLTAIEDPLSVFEDATAGHVTPEGAEALRVVYPKLFDFAKAQVMELVTEQKSQIPYQTRVQLSILFGTPMDSTLRPEFVGMMQQYARGQGQGPDRRQAKPGALTKADSMQTDVQRREMR